jgi:hypothetical protein
MLSEANTYRVWAIFEQRGKLGDQRKMVSESHHGSWLMVQIQATHELTLEKQSTKTQAQSPQISGSPHVRDRLQLNRRRSVRERFQAVSRGREVL